MTEEKAQEMQVKDKQEVGQPEQTSEAPVFTPNVDIFETRNEITLLADLPGVKPENLSIDLNEGVLTLTGDIEPYENADEQDLMIEYEVGRYFRQFTLSEMIDQNKIEANLKDGELRLRLPKAEKAQPRKIEVKAG
ncbi:MAG: Hsp20/alpha crystallin family protein [Desulfosalsimonadaceae bacterium]